jgi:hypothetical protein
MQPPNRSATRIIANLSSSSTPRLRRQPTIRDTAGPGRARTRRDSAAGTSREHEAPMSLENTGEFPKLPTQDQRQDAADTRATIRARATESLSNSPDISEATSQEISRGTSSARTTRAADTYGVRGGGVRPAHFPPRGPMRRGVVPHVVLCDTCTVD